MDASLTPIPPASTPLLQLRGISKRFVQPVDLAGKIANLLGAHNAPAVVQAVSEVDLDIHAGEVIGVVGESGCGKSTLGRVVAGINPPSAGEISYQGRKLAESEVVHHINGNNADNRLANLQLTTFSDDIRRHNLARYTR